MHDPIPPQYSLLQKRMAWLHTLYNRLLAGLMQFIDTSQLALLGSWLLYGVGRAGEAWSVVIDGAMNVFSLADRTAHSYWKRNICFSRKGQCKMRKLPRLIVAAFLAWQAYMLLKRAARELQRQWHWGSPCQDSVFARAVWLTLTRCSWSARTETLGKGNTQNVCKKKR